VNKNIPQNILDCYRETKELLIKAIQNDNFEAVDSYCFALSNLKAEYGIE